MRAGRDEGGLLTMYVAIFSVALLVLCGLVVDGGYVLAGRRRAIDEANGAARAGAQALSPDSYRSGTVTLDPVRAEAAAREFLAATGHGGTVTVNGDQVTVQTSFDQQTALLGIIGIRRVTVSGRGRAAAVRGITTGVAP